jgi:DNA repair photolyase
VERILELAAEAGATDIGGIALHLRGEVKGLFFDWLRSHRPDVLPRYEKLYRRGAYAPKEERERLSRLARPKGARPRRSPRGADETAMRVDPADPPQSRPGTERQPTLF